MGTKNALTEKVYSGKDIMRIAYPILISLLMEQMIGMTDTAFLAFWLFWKCVDWFEKI